MARAAFVLVPWGLLAGPEMWVELGEGQDSLAPAGSSPLLFVDRPEPPLLNGGDSLRLESRFRTLQGQQQRLYRAPLPLCAGDCQTLLVPGWRQPARISWAGIVDRPSPSTAVDEVPPGGPWQDFLLRLVGRMEDVRAGLSDTEGPWAYLLDLWLERERSHDATMDILVRHARQHRLRFEELVEHPRRLLRRERELLPLSRVEELDTRSMAWLTRQPGRSLVERAGPRQRILAPARRSSADTLENRVLRDLLERSDAAARTYLRANETFRGSERFRLVEGYRRTCHGLARELAAEGVSLPHPPIQPNFVLQQDNRYRHVWQAWQEIVRRQRVQDDLWRWQGRAWAEFCTAAVAATLHGLAGSEPIAASPVAYRAEQDHGQWLAHDEPLCVLLDRERGWVVELLGSSDVDLDLGLAEFGASAWLRRGSLDGAMLRYIAVWTLHGMGEAKPLSDLVASAEHGLRIANDIRQARGRVPVAGGLVLQSSVVADAPAESVRQDRIEGLTFGPAELQLSSGLELLLQALERLLARP